MFGALLGALIPLGNRDGNDFSVEVSSFMSMRRFVRQALRLCSLLADRGSFVVVDTGADSGCRLRPEEEVSKKDIPFSKHNHSMSHAHLASSRKRQTGCQQHQLLSFYAKALCLSRRRDEWTLAGLTHYFGDF